MQAPGYERGTDFSEQSSDETDHVALNKELDGVAQSITVLRDNAALIQQDDGKLRAGIVTAETVAPAFLQELTDEIAGNVAEIADQVRQDAQVATLAATSAKQSEINSDAHETAALAARNSARLSEQAALQSATAAHADRLAGDSARNEAQAAATTATAKAVQTAADALGTAGDRAATETARGIAVAAKNSAENSASIASTGAAATANDVVTTAQNAASAAQSAVAAAASAESVDLAHIFQTAQWLVPISHCVGIQTQIAGVQVPPDDSPFFRFIKLSASDPYNAGILINETVSGSAPNLTATAEVNLPGSPFHGLRINLLNTERRFLRPGSPGVLADSTNLLHGHTGTTNSAGSHVHILMWDTNQADHGVRGYVSDNGTGANAQWTSGTMQAAGDHTHVVTVAESGSSESAPRSMGVTLFMRAL